MSHPSNKVRRLLSRLSSLLLLLQRSPLVQLLFPEARLAGGAGLGELTKWTVATVAGLGAFDTVAGATTITQLSPNAGSSTVPATGGSPLSFVFQCTGAPGAPKSWSVSGKLPAGLTHTNATKSATDSITGTPTETGDFPITVKAWEDSNQSGGSSSKSFTIVVSAIAPKITTQPVSTTINSGGTTTLTVAASGTSPKFQWYKGSSGVTANPISGATSKSFTTPALTTNTSFWVRVSNSAGKVDSTTAVVSIRIAPAITTHPVATTIGSGETATLSVAASGTSPTFQWYAGNPPDTANPISGATQSSFTTPVLTASQSYWVRASNPAGNANSQGAAISVVPPPVITSQPIPVSIRSGASATLSIDSTGVPPLSWQWYLGQRGDISLPVNGATGPTFTTPPLTAATTYWVRVTDALWHTDSQMVTVSIDHFVLTTRATHGSVTGAGSYEDQTTATLVPTPAAGYVFNGWSGDASGTANPLSLVIDSAKMVEALFTPDTADTDSDGLDNYTELVVTKTNPNKADTDGDGLTDGQEVNVVRTKPKVADTDGNGIKDALEDPDGDGLTSALELNTFHTNPLLADSNADGLSDTFAACFSGTAVKPCVGNKISLNLKKLIVTGNTLKVTGTLPPGLKYSASTGLLAGTLTGVPGKYSLTIQVLKGTTILRKFTLKIPVLAFPASLVASFEGILEDANSVPVGACRITIPQADQWTATLETKGAAKRKATGTFILKQGVPVAPITATFAAATGVPAVTVKVSISGSSPTFAGTCTGGTLRGFRLAAGQENPVATVPYNLVLDAGVQNGVSVPAGLGWMSGTVNNLGTGSFKGLLGDGTSASLTVHLSTTGQAVIWAQPYSNKNSYIGGIATLGNLGQPANTAAKLTDSLWWSKTADAATLSYPGGFPAMPVTLGTSKWIVPATATELGASLGWRNDRTAAVKIDGAGLDNAEPQTTPAALPTEFTLDDALALVPSATAITPLVAWTGTAATATGKFSGTLTIPAGFPTGVSSGAAAASGVFVQDDSWGTVTGCGLIKVPTTGPAGSFRTAAMVFDQ